MKKMVGQKKYQKFIFIIIILLCFIVTSSPLAQAQQPLQWSPQAQIPFYEVFTEEPPFLIADQNYGVHAINAQPLDLGEPNGERAIVYRQWTVAAGWTDPIDIIVNPSRGQLELMDVHFDQEAVVHLVIQMNFQELYYTQAPLAIAGRATAWSVPTLVTQQAIAARKGMPYTAAVTRDHQDNLVVIYSGWQEGNGIYATYSADKGYTWSDAESIYLTYDPEILPTDPKLEVDRAGNAHAVWSSFLGDGSGGPGYYTRLDMGSRQWRELMDLDMSGGIRTPNVIAYNDQIFLSYYNHRDNANWWRRSLDGGQTWSTPARISPLHHGTNGIVHFVVDGSQTLRLFFGQRIDDNNHGMWHSIWQGDRWSGAQPVVRGPQVRDKIGGKGFDPRSARAVISNGNIVLVTWGTDGAAKENGSWYSHTRLDVPQLPSVPLQMPTARPTKTPLPTVTPSRFTPTPSPMRSQFINGPSDSANAITASPAAPFASGLALVGGVLILIISVRHVYHRFRF